MGLVNLNRENRNKEQEIEKQIFQCISERKSFVFNAGAGAGKSYALVQCLKYVINEYGKELEIHNQKVICITYTNVATNHIKEELGNTELIKVSTIHERIWELINTHQEELVELHTEKIEEEISKMQIFLDGNKKYKALTNEQRSDFFEVMSKKKNDYNEAYNYNASNFRERIKSGLEQYGDLLSDVSVFKKIVDCLFRIERYRECIEEIKQKQDGYTSVSYDAKYNSSRLDRMRISHDTVLEYGYKMIHKYSLLKQMIIDSYPYIFIDEYQDTALEVVEIMAMLDAHSRVVKHPVCIGYFGDAIQNIYEDGIGSKLQEYHQIENEIKKEINRRSYAEIIEVANTIRQDGLVQQSIYSDCMGGSVEIFQKSENEIDEFVNKYVKEWDATIEKPIHCFVTTNKDVAQRNGFGELYSIVSDADIYQGINYQKINTEFLSNRVENLGKVPSLFYRIINFYSLIQEESTALSIIFRNKDTRDVNLDELRKIVCELKNIKGTNLNEILLEMETIASKDRKCFEILDAVLDLEKGVSVVTAKNFVRENFFSEIKEDDLAFEQKDAEIKERVEHFFVITIEQFVKWYEYINMSVKASVIYHTYHGTKGLEYENVLIIMGDGIGSKKSKLFSDYFIKFDDEKGLMEADKAKYEEARNLLYVAVTRAIRNLRILYVGNLMNKEIIETKLGMKKGE